MIRLRICNELFEGWEFGQVCRTVKAFGYDGLEIAPFTLGPRITQNVSTAPAGATGDGQGLQPGDDRLLAKTEVFYLTIPDDMVRLRTAGYLVALVEATRDLGGSLMSWARPGSATCCPA